MPKHVDPWCHELPGDIWLIQARAPIPRMAVEANIWRTHQPTQKLGRSIHIRERLRMSRLPTGTRLVGQPNLQGRDDVDRPHIRIQPVTRNSILLGKPMGKFPATEHGAPRRMDALPGWRKGMAQ